MTLEEAIKHCEEVAEEHTKYNFYGGFESCDECASEHRQLAEWLRELKKIKTIMRVTDKIWKKNLSLGINTPIDGYDVLFSCYKQIEEVLEEVKADEYSD